MKIKQIFNCFNDQLRLAERHPSGWVVETQKSEQGHQKSESSDMLKTRTLAILFHWELLAHVWKH